VISERWSVQRGHDTHPLFSRAKIRTPDLACPEVTCSSVHAVHASTLTFSSIHNKMVLDCIGIDLGAPLSRSRASAIPPISSLRRILFDHLREPHVRSLAELPPLIAPSPPHRQDQPSDYNSLIHTDPRVSRYSGSLPRPNARTTPRTS